MHPYFIKIYHIFEDKYDRQNKLKESRMTSIILNGKKQLMFCSVRSEQSNSYIVIWDTYIKWLIISTDWLRPTQTSNFFSIRYNVIPTYVQIYYALTFLW